jgi:Putative Ig domain
MLLRLVLAAAAAAAATQGPTPSPIVTPSGTPTPASTTPTLTGAPQDHADLILWLIVGGIIVAGCVVIVGRYYLKQGLDGTAASLIRSWIAISLVIGLMVFCAAALLGNNASLQSTLFGGLIASTGAAIAFYFSSQAAGQARADILHAAAIGQAVAKPSAFSGSAPPDGSVNNMYRHRFIADGFPAPMYGVASGGLPPGLTLDPDGSLHGQPEAAGTFTFKVAAANSAGFIASPDLTVTISA